MEKERKQVQFYLDSMETTLYYLCRIADNDRFQEFYDELRDIRDQVIGILDQFKEER